MKRFTTFLALGCLIALSLTSCLKDNDNDNNEVLTKSQVAQCVNIVRGEYTGMLLYPATNPKDAYDTVDTIDTRMSIGTDTMLVIRNFPSQIVAEHIADASLKEALLEQASTKELRCYLGFYNVEPLVQFLVGPVNVEYPVFYKDKTRTLTLIFWVDNAYSGGISFGYKEPSSGLMEGRIVMAYAFLDGETTKNYFNASSSAAQIPIIFTTQKKEDDSKQSQD